MNNTKLNETARAFYQPHKSLVQAQWGTATDSVYTLPETCKGAKLGSTAAADGLLEIHLVDDPASTWYLLDLEKSVPAGAIFDKIRTTNSTADLTKTTLFPV